MEAYTEQKIYDDLERNNKAKNIVIKDTTAKAYVRNIIKLMKMINATSYLELVSNFKDIEFQFHLYREDKDDGKTYPLYSDNTIKNYCNCIVMVSGWDVCDKPNDVDMNKLNDYYLMVKERINQKQLDNVKTEKQEENWITTKEFDEVIKKMRKHIDSSKGSTPEDLQDFVIMLLYSGKWIKPLRNDYAGMFFTTEYNADELYPKQNFIYVDIIHTLEGDEVVGKIYKFTVCLNDDKVSKHYGSRKYNINKQSVLTKYLRDLYIHRNESAKESIYLLVNPQDNQPMSKNNLTKNLQRITKTWLNKKVSTSALRHMYISNLDHNKTSNKKLAEIATDMRHSLPTQQQNYKIVDKEDTVP